MTPVPQPGGREHILMTDEPTDNLPSRPTGLSESCSQEMENRGSTKQSQGGLIPLK